jgi:PAS domain S-box-containing protein
LNRLLLVISSAWTVFALQYGFQGRFRTVLIDVGVISSTLLVQVWFLRQATLERMRVASHLAAGLSCLGLVAAAMISGQSAAMATWFLVFVAIFMSHQEGQRAAIVWSILAALGAVAVHGSELFVTFIPEFVPSDAEVLAGQLVFLAAALGISLATRRASDEQLRIVHDRGEQLRRSRDAARMLTERLSTLVENVNVGVVLTDSRDRVLRVNTRFREQFSIDEAADGLAGLPFDELCVRHITPMRAGGHSCDRTGEGQQSRAELELRNGQVLELEKTQIGDENAEAGFVTCYRDITHHKEVERMKNEFVSTVSHELRTPLTAIRGSLALMAGGVAGELPRQSRELVEMADANAQRLIRLISDILDLQKAERGGVQLAVEEICGIRLVHEVAESLRPAAAEQGVALVVHSNGAPLDVSGDPDRLTQVLTNLISNAVAFSGSEQAVEVTAKAADGGRVRFEVRDHGPGISTADQDRLFQQFQQLDGSDRRRKGGTGLGLAISKALVEQHGGSIGVESQLGYGAAFWFEI